MKFLLPLFLWAAFFGCAQSNLAPANSSASSGRKYNPQTQNFETRDQAAGLDAERRSSLSPDR